MRSKISLPTQNTTKYYYAIQETSSKAVRNRVQQWLSEANLYRQQVRHCSASFRYRRFETLFLLTLAVFSFDNRTNQSALYSHQRRMLHLVFLSTA